MPVTRRHALGGALGALAVPVAARAATQAAPAPGGTPVAIEMFFPVPVQGTLATEMQSLISEFNKAHADVHVTPVYTGSYDDTNLKTRAAIHAGRPPAAVIMSANFIREYVINDEALPLDPLIAAGNTTPAQYMDRFWPALKINAVIDGTVYGIPFQNSTPLLYYSVEAFQRAGLDPNQPPATWDEWVSMGRKLSAGGRHGLVMPGSYDYCGWLTSALAMANGGQYFNQDYGGEVYYNDPTTVGALRLLENMVGSYGMMPKGALDSNAVTASFFSGQSAMMLLSTGALGFVRSSMRTPYRVAFMPRKLTRAAPIGGGSLLIPKGNTPERQRAAWTLIDWLTSPAISGRWSRFTGYFAPNKGAYDLPEMKQYLQQHPDAKVALDQLRYARPWFATYQTVAVRKAMEDQVQAILAGRAHADAAASAAQRQADQILSPYVQQTALKLPA